MPEGVTRHDYPWLKARIARHTHELFRLGWPVMLSRLGVVTLGLADTIMIGDYSTTQLAYLNLGNATFIMVYLVVAIGLLIGTLIHTADAYGRDDYEECGRVYKRSLPYSIGLGLFLMVISWPAEWLFLLNGQTAELAHEGGRVMVALSFGLVGHLVFVNTGFFLEALSRPKPVLVIMVIGNLLNIALNYVLIYGKLGFPAMGAVGSAWATTTLRLVMMALILGYVFLAPSLAKYKLRTGFWEPWNAWKSQRMKGYAAAFSLGVEVAAFAALTVFAGWLGTLPLAAYGVVFSVMTIPFMLAAGLGSATSIRVGVANARPDKKDTALAGWVGYGLGTLVLVGCSIPIYLFNHEIIQAYSDDPALIAFGAGFVAFAGFIIIVDGGQALLASALRGLGETWGPTIIQTFVYIVIMIPASYWLAFPVGHGVMGLLEAMVYASIVSVALQGWRFYHKTKAAYPLVDKG